MRELVESIYDERFDDAEAARKDRIWRELARYLQRFVGESAVVLDIGCDRGDFIRNVAAREKWAADLRDVSRYLSEDVHFVQADGLQLEGLLPAGHFDCVFMSNYLEHLHSGDSVIAQFAVAAGLLKRAGRVVVLQPNVRLVKGAYWDFIDHKVPLTEKSLVEAAGLAGLRPLHVVTRFLPYTTKSALPQHPALVRAYLRLRPAWLLVGKQTLFVAEKA
jgi:SAM-dependent methyltransferase